VKSGARALGVAESFEGTTTDSDGSDSDMTTSHSTLAGAVVRADRVVDGVAFGRCTVGGTDVTDGVATLLERLDRPDVRHVLVAGIALSWYNVLDLPALADRCDRPVISVTFGESPGLEPALRAEFSGEALDKRLATYERQPPRHAVDVDDGTVFVRSAGLDADEAADIVRSHTPEGGRPEPLRVARLAARAADEFVA
jgi:endonuclease V-like protein UPF0215 family